MSKPSPLKGEGSSSLPKKSNSNSEKSKRPKQLTKPLGRQSDLSEKPSTSMGIERESDRNLAVNNSKHSGHQA